ncbi:hypothetical protein [Kineococcus radiotolerans]|uniref:Uncharacterized protein n=1 Tax=Kineococcus radiotolerans (strain ATCC BAA-149 / DSM 14245 / SRS30216) TaxID=266940 RepID=A6WGT4_KINRD|nr:hypothetical protein [Kineococcus radiotolerans]ABS06023.1 hypothetical protein Krad_4564 [Kineococcus radiotolerans SRS30216 = ATCC BAA-149]
MDVFKEYFAALAPSTGLGLLFWLLMRSVLRADRSERAAARRVRQERSEHKNPQVIRPTASDHDTKPAQDMR